MRVSENVRNSATTMSAPFAGLGIIHLGKMERRYVYSCCPKPEKFQSNTRRHSGSLHAKAWADIAISLLHRFSGPRIRDVEHISFTSFLFITTITTKNTGEIRN